MTEMITTTPTTTAPTEDALSNNQEEEEEPPSTAAKPTPPQHQHQQQQRTTPAVPTIVEEEDDGEGGDVETNAIASHRKKMEALNHRFTLPASPHTLTTSAVVTQPLPLPPPPPHYPHPSASVDGTSTHGTAAGTETDPQVLAMAQLAASSLPPNIDISQIDSTFPFNFTDPVVAPSDLDGSVPFNGSLVSSSSSISAHPILPDCFQMSIAVQPPLKTVYQRILKPFPAISLTLTTTPGVTPEFSESLFDGLFVEATLLRGDNGVPLPKCIDGNCLVRFEKRSRNWSDGLYAAFKKLKILSTSQQLQGTLLRLKFTLKRYSGNSFATVQVPYCSVISHPIEVFSHTQYLQKSKEGGGMKASASGIPVPFELGADGTNQKKRRDWRKSSDRTYDRASSNSNALTSTVTGIVPVPLASHNSTNNSNSVAATTSLAPIAVTAAVNGSTSTPLVSQEPGQDGLVGLANSLLTFKESGGTYHMAIDVLNQIFGLSTASSTATIIALQQHQQQNQHANVATAVPAAVAATYFDGRSPYSPPVSILQPSLSLIPQNVASKSMLKSTTASLSTLA
eukprot:TRINITY_DN5851_c0_g1_i2.p1 TRINITY_DN5851_c0_g1~~TRINITY_DN5851_c0_g1_i2.p1  ORF type:complete len:567 (+),score=119.79 TRINITY_DN5851_c0_g1_i2:186-1886(+)